MAKVALRFGCTKQSKNLKSCLVHTPAEVKIICDKNERALVSMVFTSNESGVNPGKEKGKRMREPFRICLINSTANPAQLGWNSARLAVLRPSCVI